MSQQPYCSGRSPQMREPARTSSMKGSQPSLQDVAATLLQRQITPDEGAQADCGLQYQTVEPRMVDLSWVGRQAANHPAHQALARIQTGDPIELIKCDGRW